MSRGSGAWLLVYVYYSREVDECVYFACGGQRPGLRR